MITEYYHKYLLTLTKFPYTYQLSSNIFVNVQDKLLECLEKLTLDINTPNETLIGIEGVLTLTEANIWAKKSSLLVLSEKMNF